MAKTGACCCSHPPKRNYQDLPRVIPTIVPVMLGSLLGIGTVLALYFAFQH